MSRKRARCSICGAPCYESANPNRLPACERCRYSRDALHLAEEVQKFEHHHFAFQDHVKKTIKTTKPIILAWTSDWHLGGMHTDHAAILAHVRTLIETPNVFVVTGGDLYDNFRVFKNVEAIFAQALPPKWQARTVADLMERIASTGRLLGCVWGNHDVERDERLFGESPAAAMYASHAPFFRGVGKIDLTVGKVVYNIFATHNARSNAENPFNVYLKSMKKHGPFDLLLTAHTHDSVGGWFPWGGRRVHALRPGAFSGGDLFSQRYYQGGFQAQPAAVLFPDTKKIVPFEYLEDAIAYTKGLK